MLFEPLSLPHVVHPVERETNWLIIVGFVIILSGVAYVIYQANSKPVYVQSLKRNQE
jgi:uncharacterized membrane protein